VVRLCVGGADGADPAAHGSDGDRRMLRADVLGEPVDLSRRRPH